MIPVKSWIPPLFLVAVATVTGFFLVQKTQQTEKEIEAVSRFEPVRQEEQTSFGDSDLLDMSKWKTYWNEEYGFELKYPEDYVIIIQPGSNKEQGLLLFVREQDYMKYKNTTLFEENPLLVVIQNNGLDSFQMSWNSHEWVTQTFSSESEESFFREMLMGFDDTTTHFGDVYKTSLSKMQEQKIQGEKIYYFERKIEKVKNDTDSVASGFALKRGNAFFELSIDKLSSYEMRKHMFSIMASLRAM